MEGDQKGRKQVMKSTAGLSSSFSSSLAPLFVASCLIITCLHLISVADAKVMLHEDSGALTNTNARQGIGMMMSNDSSNNDYIYSFDKIWTLFYTDVVRWMAILEDVIAETIRSQFLNGIVDRKTVKLGMRYFMQNLFISLSQQGYFSEKNSNINLWPSSPSGIFRNHLHHLTTFSGAENGWGEERDSVRLILLSQNSLVSWIPYSPFSSLTAGRLHTTIIMIISVCWITTEEKTSSSSSSMKKRKKL